MKSTNKPSYKPPNPGILQLAEKHANQPEALLEVLKEAQASEGHLQSETVTDVARALKIPPSRAYGVASFYSMLALEPRPSNILRVCNGPVCWLCGGEKVRRVADELLRENPDWAVENSSCLGLCDRAPAALVNDEQAGPVTLDQLNGLVDGWRGRLTDYSQPRRGEMRVMMSKAGLIDPDSLVSALAYDAYCGLSQALRTSPQDVLAEVETSGLTGRGGAGFPVGRKWRFVAQASPTPKKHLAGV